MQICPRDVGPCVKCGVPVYEGQSRLMFCIDWNLLILLRNSIHVDFEYGLICLMFDGL